MGRGERQWRMRLLLTQAPVLNTESPPQGEGGGGGGGADTGAQAGYNKPITPEGEVTKGVLPVW